MWFDLIGISSNCGDVQLIYGVVESIVIPPQRTKYKECVLLSVNMSRSIGTATSYTICGQ